MTQSVRSNQIKQNRKLTRHTKKCTWFMLQNIHKLYVKEHDLFPPSNCIWLWVKAWLPLKVHYRMCSNIQQDVKHSCALCLRELLCLFMPCCWSMLQCSMDLWLFIPMLSHDNFYIFYKVANSYEFVRPHSYNFRALWNWFNFFPNSVFSV